jgi:uncharacterized repeat protein (TIGR03803 family)
MQSQELSIGFAVLLGIFAVTTLMTAMPAAAQTEKVLYSFGHENEYGIQPAAGLVVDAAGNLFGTTQNGSVLTLAGGTVFELTKMCGHWTEKVLHQFGSGEDGASPLAGLILDAAGSLYGTTQAGGAYNSGTVFELSAHSRRRMDGEGLAFFQPRRQRRHRSFCRFCLRCQGQSLRHDRGWRV